MLEWRIIEATVLQLKVGARGMKSAAIAVSMRLVTAIAAFDLHSTRPCPCFTRAWGPCGGRDGLSPLI